MTLQKENNSLTQVNSTAVVYARPLKVVAIKQSINSLHTMISRLYLASLSSLKICLLQWTAKKFNFLNLLGGHPIYKYCVCFIVAPQQVSLLILSFLTAEKNQGTHFIITLQVRTRQHFSVKHRSPQNELKITFSFKKFPQNLQKQCSKNFRGAFGAENE